MSAQENGRGRRWRLALALACCAGAAPRLSAQDAIDEAARLFAAGEFAAAEKRLEGLATPRAQAVRALARAASGRCDEAEGDLRAAFDSKRDRDTRRLAGLALARCAVAGKRFDEAAAALYPLQTEFAADADVLYEVARLHLRGFDGAVERLFERAPASFRANQLSAEIFEIQGRYSEAVAEYRKALEKAPPRTLNLHYRLGRALLMESHEPAALEAARKEFEAELAIHPRDAVAEYQIAQILNVQGRRDEAARRLERAVELDPAFAEAAVALGRLRLEAGDAAAAIALLERAVALAPQSESAQYSLMLAYRNAGRRDDARRAQQRLDELQRASGGEFEDFLRRIGEAPQP